MAKSEKSAQEAHKNLLFCHFYTEMVKLSNLDTFVIIFYIVLFFFFLRVEETGQENIWGQMPPYRAATEKWSTEI